MHDRRFFLPPRRFRNAVTNPRQHQRGQPADREHYTPPIVAEASADRVVDNGGKKDAHVIAGVHVARPSSASILGPLLRDERAAHRPLATNPDSSEQTEDGQLPYAR